VSVHRHDGPHPRWQASGTVNRAPVHANGLEITPRRLRAGGVRKDRLGPKCRGSEERNAAVKIILTQDVVKLGAAGSLQEVKPGYARNYLIPRAWRKSPPPA
jgi:hypothetical protein